MRKGFIEFYKNSLKNFLGSLVNFVIFLPYFFSVITLFKTLFYPWKNLVAKKTTVGFTFSEWFNRVGFNLISRMIGFIMRFSIICFYFISQIVFLILIPFITLVYLFIIPLLFIESLFEKPEEEKKNILKTRFINSHLQKYENQWAVENWFNSFYGKKIHKFIPPLARDWAVGYTPLVDQYSIDLASPGYQKKMKNISNREKEINEIERILLKSEANNVIIVGEEGVGKHTIVDALAKKMYEGRINRDLLYKRILKLNMEKILARENFLEELFEETSTSGNVILLIENFDKYISYLAIPIEKFARTGELQIIAITTPFFYQKFILTNEKINKFFTKVDVYEVTRDEAQKILLDAAILFEERYKLTILYETVKNTIEKSDYYITHIPFPEKAVELLDAACVYVKENKNKPPRFDKINEDRTSEVKNIVSPDIIDIILTEKTHTPTTLTSNLKQKLVELETLLMSQIVQQEEAVKKLSNALRRSFILIGKRKKPLGTFIFLGPTGVGKTQTAKAIAQIFFGSEKKLIRFDMSEYQSKTDIPKLIGSVDTGNPGLLSAAIRENPYTVLLLDELEKADHDLINIFLTVLDEGYFTDGFGKRVDCKNLVIIATSNAGSDMLYASNAAIGGTTGRVPDSAQFTSTGGKDKSGQNLSQPQLINYLIEQHIFSPEFLNRFDGIILFKPLSQEAVVEIAKKMLSRITEDIYNLHKIKLNVSNNYLSELAQKGYDPKFGARNMERVINDEIEDKVAKMLLENKVKEGDIISL